LHSPVKLHSATQEKESGTVWLSDQHSVSLNPQPKIFSFADQSLSAIAQQKLLRYILTRRAQGQSTRPRRRPHLSQRRDVSAK
jgi:hypothetical protein